MQARCSRSPPPGASTPRSASKGSTCSKSDIGQWKAGLATARLSYEIGCSVPAGTDRTDEVRRLDADGAPFGDPGGSPFSLGCHRASSGVRLCEQRQHGAGVFLAADQQVGQTLRAQNLCPVLERQVRSDDGLAALVALREGLEQKLGGCRGQRHIAQFVDDQQFHRLEVALQLEQPLLIAGPPLTG